MALTTKHEASLAQEELRKALIAVMNSRDFDHLDWNHKADICVEVEGFCIIRGTEERDDSNMNPKYIRHIHIYG